MSAPLGLGELHASMRRQVAELDRKAGMAVQGEPAAALLFTQFAEMMRENIEQLECLAGGPWS